MSLVYDYFTSAFSTDKFALLSFIGLSIALIGTWLRRRSRHDLPLPPGPPRTVLLGNALDMPKKEEWLTFSKWAREYGDVVHLRMFGQDLIVLNTFEAATDLLEKRSGMYSDRPRFVIIGDLIGVDYVFSTNPYGSRWRTHRRAFHQVFNSNASMKFVPTQEKHVRELLPKLNADSKEWIKHVQHMTVGTIMESLYGLSIQESNDPIVHTIEKAMDIARDVMIPGKYFVETFPILNYLPGWMPGGTFKQYLPYWKKSFAEMRDMPYKIAKRSYRDGTLLPSYLSYWLDRLPPSDDSNEKGSMAEIVRNVCVTAYAGGFETSATALQFFVLAMVQNPSVQLTAHAELDQVVGYDRMVSMEDRPSLPYINAVVKEVFRWHPLTPLSIPHRVMEEDVYKGWRIPKGATILPNAWMMLRDEKTYGSKTDEFRPERFLKKGVPEPNAAFGFGRRICPGRYLADNTLFLSIASMLQLFNIVKATDINGQEVEVNPTFEPGLISHPTPFECDFKLRFEASGRLLQSLE